VVSGPLSADAIWNGLKSFFLPPIQYWWYFSQNPGFRFSSLSFLQHDGPFDGCPLSCPKLSHYGIALPWAPPIFHLLVPLPFLLLLFCSFPPEMFLGINPLSPPYFSWRCWSDLASSLQHRESWYSCLVSWSLSSPLIGSSHSTLLSSSLPINLLKCLQLTFRSLLKPFHLDSLHSPIPLFANFPSFGYSASSPAGFFFLSQHMVFFFLPSSFV